MIKRNRRDRMRRRHGWPTSVKVVCGLVLASAVVSAFVFDDMGLSKYLSMLQQADQLEQDIVDVKEANAALRQEIQRVQQDPAHIEALARDRLGLVREGETVYYIVEEPEE